MATAHSFRDVVLIADIFQPGNSNELVHLRRDLEMTEVSTLDAILGTIRALGFKVHHYRSPAQLSRNAWRHKEDIVLAIFGGQRSRNRMALVPAVCEAFSLLLGVPSVGFTYIAQASLAT